MAALNLPEGWQRRGACLGVTGVNFFPGKGESVEPARAVCQGCEVLDVCRTWALHHEVYGVWGGLTGRDRLKIRKLEGISVETPGIQPEDGPERGTTGGYARHIRRKERPCFSCRQAHNLANSIRGKERRAEKRGERPPRGPQRRKVAECATTGGYEAHLRRSETPCDECKEAKAEYQRARRAATRAEAANA